MQRRINWKKGMRLTDQILSASDDCAAELVGRAFIVAAAGRFGLLPSTKPFELSLNILQGFVSVETLNCVAITRAGNLIDVEFDTRYTNTFDARVAIPDIPDLKELILIISVDSVNWVEAGDGYKEPVYSFSLVEVNKKIPENAIPIARLVNEYGWHMDDIDFIPPCLYVSSHPRYEELLSKYIHLLSSIDSKARLLVRSNAKNAVRVFWPLIQQLLITVEKEKDLMTPMTFFASVQKCVSAFTCACDMDEYLNLSDAEIFRNYVQMPYNYKDVYDRIKEGLQLCFSINEKVDKIQLTSNEPVATPHTEAPFIETEHLFKECKTRTVAIPVTNIMPGATVYYSTDGKEPVRKLPANKVISIETGFNKVKVAEPNKIIIVKLKAILGKDSSDVNSFSVTLHKNYKEWDGFEI